MPTAADIKNYVKPEVAPLYTYSAEIDTTPNAASPTWAAVCAGFNNISEALNESVQQYFFLCGNGFAANYVTGMAPAITLSGRRIYGDTAQDYIFGKKYDLMSARDTHFRLKRTDAAGTTTTVISANVTLCNMTDVSGAANDASACSVEIRFNGAPFQGDAWAESVSVTQTLTACTSSFTADYVYKGAQFVAFLTPDSGKTLGTLTVTMGGVSVADAWNADQGAITIANVTGAIAITATAS